MIWKAFGSALVLTCCVSCSLFGGHKKTAATPAPATANTGHSKMDTRQIQEKAARLSGRKDIRVLEVPDQGLGAETMTKGLSAIWGESGVPKELRKQLKNLHDQGGTAFVGGNSPAKTEWALREALVHSQARSLQGTLIYTNAKLTDELKAAGRGAGVSVLKLDL